MACRLTALSCAAHEPAALASFWSGLLGREVEGDGNRDGDLAMLAAPDPGFAITFVASDLPKDGLNQVHLHLTSATPEGQQATVARALALGASHLDVGQRPEEGHVVLADPEGNEFCVIEAGNGFLAGTGFLGELACDGTQEVGHFWSHALGWPLVWDQDEETSIQSPSGGTKISWGGPPVRGKTCRNRFHFDLTPTGSDQEVEVQRLVALGATRVGTSPHDPTAVELTDPDGNEFCVLTPR